MYLNSKSKLEVIKLDPSIIQVEALEPGIGLIDLDLREIKSLFKTHAAVLFTGFQPDMRIFEQFTDQFCSDWMLYQGGAHIRQILNEKTDRTVYSVNIYMGQENQYMWELPMHSDMSYQGHHPAILFFYCLTPSRNGGETALCDGLRVYQALRPETREFFHKNNIRYIRTGNWRVRFQTDSLDDVRDWCRLSGLNFSHDAKTDVVTSEYVTSAVPVDQRGDVVFCNSILPVLWQEDEGHDKSLVRLENGLPIPEDIVKEIRDVTKLNRVLVKMRQNDVIWVDNTRTLHGRMEFDDPDRNVGIRMGRHINW